MAQLPSKTFYINYNAKDFDGDRTIPQTQGQTFTEDLQLSSQVTAYTQDHITLDGQYFLKSNFNNNPFNRSGNDGLTIIMKVSQGVDTTGVHAIIANRGSSYNWMVFNPANDSPNGMVFLHSAEGDYSKCPYIQMVDTTVPNVFAFRVSGGTGFGQSYTDNQTFASTGVTWGNFSNGFGIFCGGHSAGENWKGDFYWLYISPEYLTDAEVNQVIVYNEGIVPTFVQYIQNGQEDASFISGWEVDTQYYPTQNTKVQIKINKPAPNDGNITFGTNEQSGSYFRFFTHGTPPLQKMFFDCPYDNSWRGSVDYTLGTDAEFEMGINNNSRPYLINLTTSQTVTSNSNFSQNGTKTLKLWKQNVTVSQGTKVYYIKIYEQNVLVRDLVPAIVNNVVGLYDNITGNFYGPSSGAKALTAGPLVNSIYAEADTELFRASGGTATIDITTNNGWSASTTDNWITLSSSTGSGDTTITVTIPNYTGTTDRTDTITFTDTTTGDEAEITIRQKRLINGQPVYLGSYEVTELYLGSSAVTEAYLGTELVYSLGAFVGIQITQNISFAKTGGTQNIIIKSSDNWEILGVPAWLTLSSTAGTSGNTTITATTQDNQAGSALSATLSAYTTNSAYSATCEVVQAYCNPIVISAQTSPYEIATAAMNMGATEYTDCLWDFTGVREISDMDHGKTPRVRTGGQDYSYSRSNITYVNINTSDCQIWDYAFNEMSGLTYIEVDMSSTQSVENFLYRCPNLQTVVLNNCPTTGVTSFNGGCSNGAVPNLANVYVNGSLPGSCDMKLFYEGGNNEPTGLTVASLNRIIAALPTVGASGSNRQTCFIGTTNINKLSAAEIQVATDKGWDLQ